MDDDALRRLLIGWTADARAEDELALRTSLHWKRQQAMGEATAAGLLLDLVERGTSVALLTSYGERYGGTLLAVGIDFLAVAQERQAPTLLLRTDCLAAVDVDTHPRSAGVPSNRSIPPGARSLGDVLADLADARARIRCKVRGETGRRAGSIAGVGDDLVTLHVDGPPPSTSFLTLAHLVEVLLD
jgi:hypothetical protein